MSPLLGVCIAGTFSQSVSCLFNAFMLSDEQKTVFGRSRAGKRALQMILSGKNLQHSICYGKMLKL